MRTSIPTERRILRCIFDLYEPVFPGEGKGLLTVMVPIDIEAVAKELGCEKHILFGYLYYHLDQKYKYKTGENSAVHLYAPRAGELRHAVNLPYLAAILAGLEQDHSRNFWSLFVSVMALVLSVGAILAQLFGPS